MLRINRIFPSDENRNSRKPSLSTDAEITADWDTKVPKEEMMFMTEETESFPPQSGDTLTLYSHNKKRIADKSGANQPDPQKKEKVVPLKPPVILLQNIQKKKLRLNLNSINSGSKKSNKYKRSNKTPQKTVTEESKSSGIEHIQTIICSSNRKSDMKNSHRFQSPTHLPCKTDSPLPSDEPEFDPDSLIDQNEEEKLSPIASAKVHASKISYRSNGKGVEYIDYKSVSSNQSEEVNKTEQPANVIEDEIIDFNYGLQGVRESRLEVDIPDEAELYNTDRG